MLPRYLSAYRQRKGEDKPQRGFTAIEMMVVVAILAIVAALALPSFNETIKRYRVRRAVEDFAATFQLARVESIKRGGKVTLRKATATGCTASTNQEWNCGWILFVDDNDNGTRNTGEVLIQSTLPPKGVDVMADPQRAYFKFDRWGQANGAGMMGFNFQPSGDDSPPLRLITHVCISGGGRLQVLPETPECPQ